MMRKRRRPETPEYYLERLEADVNAWEETLRSLENTLPGMPRATRERLDGQLRAVRAKYLGVQESIRDLHGTGEEVWETLRPKVEESWDACKKDLQALNAAFGPHRNSRSE
jgi:hypothetical protein